MRMVVNDDDLNCRQCLELYDRNSSKVPPCWYKACRNANYQFSGIDTWVLAAVSLKNSEIGKASAARLLELMEADDLETLSDLVELDFAHSIALTEKAERERQLEKMKMKR